MCSKVGISLTICTYFNSLLMPRLESRASYSHILLALPLISLTDAWWYSVPTPSRKTWRLQLFAIFWWTWHTMEGTLIVRASQSQCIFSDKARLLILQLVASSSLSFGCKHGNWAIWTNLSSKSWLFMVGCFIRVYVRYRYLFILSTIQIGE